MDTFSHNHGHSANHYSTLYPNLKWPTIKISASFPCYSDLHSFPLPGLSLFYSSSPPHQALETQTAATCHKDVDTPMYS